MRDESPRSGIAATDAGRVSLSGMRSSRRSITVMADKNTTNGMTDTSTQSIPNAHNITPLNTAASGYIVTTGTGHAMSFSPTDSD